MRLVFPNRIGQDELRVQRVARGGKVETGKYTGSFGEAHFHVTVKAAANDSHLVSFQSKRKPGKLYYGHEKSFWGSFIVPATEIRALADGREVITVHYESGARPE